jgi:hypothetical protein
MSSKAVAGSGGVGNQIIFAIGRTKSRWLMPGIFGATQQLKW